MSKNAGYDKGRGNLIKIIFKNPRTKKQYIDEYYPESKSEKPTLNQRPPLQLKPPNQESNIPIKSTFPTFRSGDDANDLFEKPIGLVCDFAFDIAYPNIELFATTEIDLFPLTYPNT